ncbi:uncharacterized protein LOC133122895 isoform X2 [Conger conger]|uniref:uncharacterized protein LOC133122895 isoform X2 n=1 Tax=Conger conger TaxID=82655 RepID=UPI002A5ACCC1|nr:uncharacterized protein LOC133122895 isoform X2 [Conger conger]
MMAFQGLSGLEELSSSPGVVGACGRRVWGAMEELRAVLLLFLLLLILAHVCHPALGLAVSCQLESFHVGLNLSAVCRINQPAPPGCLGQSLRLVADGQLLLPYRHTRDAGYFTVPAGPGTRLHLRCELACPGPRPNATCDITACECDVISVPTAAIFFSVEVRHLQGRSNPFRRSFPGGGATWLRQREQSYLKKILFQNGSQFK